MEPTQNMLVEESSLGTPPVRAEYGLTRQHVLNIAGQPLESSLGQAGQRHGQAFVLM